MKQKGSNWKYSVTLHVFFLNFWKNCHTENKWGTYMSGLPFLIITIQVPAISPLVKHVYTYLLKYFFMPLFIKYFRLKQNLLH